MDKETNAALFARLAQDDVLRNAVGKAASVADVIRILGDAGFTVRLEDVVSERPMNELTDAEIEGVAAAGFTTYGCNTPTQYFVFTHCYP
jgi:predicted ribosomally synthesized peptide with nif11-like leader